MEEEAITKDATHRDRVFKMTEEKKCDMCECTEAKQWIENNGACICGACMQEIKDMMDYNTQGTF